MAPLPDNNTGRVWLSYNNGHDTHTMLWRYNSSGETTPSDVMTSMAAFLTALDAFIYTINIVGVRWALAGASVSLPIAWSGDASYGTGASNDNDRAAAMQFLARSPTGRRTSFWVYAIDAVAPDGYRFLASANTAVSNAISVLNTASATERYVAIDNTDPIHYPYANWKINDYWLHQER